MIVVRARGSMSKNNLQGNGFCADIRGSNLIQSTGFTLVELMVVIAIVAVLSAIATPLYTEYIEKARVVRAIAEIKGISQAITVYEFETGKYPQSLAEVGPSAWLKSQSAMASAQPTLTTILRAISLTVVCTVWVAPAEAGDNNATLLDPWGSPYQYLNIQNSTAKGKGSFRKDRFLVPINTDYDLYSMGRDRQSTPPLTAKNSKDDVIRANNGGYIGLASAF